MSPAPPRKDYSTHTLVAHVLLALAGVAAAFFNIRSRSRHLLLATALLLLGIPASIALQSDLAFVGILCIYIATVLWAILVRAIRDESREI